ncbi:alpha/beta fold hydrolase [Chitinophaga sp. CF418]|uniref:alpha/beta fold hydrolase n=1 Tax=Chitinophaga sp. CF418 TaxID=1855287 RepID=UPI00351B507C
MFRNLMTDLSDKYHLIAPDYPGFGRSEQPPIADLSYTFDNTSERRRRTNRYFAVSILY